MVVGLAILGTVLAALVEARARYLHQWTLAGRKQEAVAIADRLLTDWWANSSKLPANASGRLDEQKMKWETHVLESSDAQSWQAKIVRLEISDLSAPAQAPPLVLVDVMLAGPAQAKP